MNTSVMIGIVIAVVVLAIAIFIILIYNNLVRLQNNVQNAWANIDVLLKQRHDELPKLISTCREYKDFEQETLKKLVETRMQLEQARESKDIEEFNPLETDIRQALNKLFIVAENYPSLKSNENFLQLQERISTLEHQITERREFYNQAATFYNTYTEQFPSRLIASRFDFSKEVLLTFQEEAMLLGTDLKAAITPKQASQ